MTNIKYTYPAMLGHAGEMTGYAGTLQALGADILAELRPGRMLIGEAR